MKAMMLKAFNMMMCYTRYAYLLVFAALFVCPAAYAQRQPSEVLVVYNASSPISTAVAQDYIAKRHITNVVAVTCADSALSTDNETIQLADYSAEIASPVSAYLAKHKNINFIVLTKGIPIRINGALTGSTSDRQPSLDSYLAAIDYSTIPGAVIANLAGSGTVGTGWINRYYNTNVPFTHAKFGGYLVTRLDGYTQSDAEGLVSEALAAERTPPVGNILFDIPSDFGLGDKSIEPLAQASTVVTSEAPWSTWNADMLHASAILEASGAPHITAITKTFVGGQNNLLGYYSWGSNDDHFVPSAYESLQFAPGSMCDTAVSTGARTFLPTSGGQTLIEDLIAHGVSCCQGYVDEPILDGTSSPTIDLTHYLSGYTMAESFYAGTRYIGWEGICVGDPLCCPYAGNKLVIPTLASLFQDSGGGVKTVSSGESGLDLGFIDNGSYTSYSDVNLSGMNRFMARVSSAGPGGNIELHLDSPTGQLIGTCPVPVTGDWQSYVTQTCDLTKKVKGAHKLYLVYTGGDGNLFNVEWFAFRGDNDTHSSRRKAR